MSVIITGMEMPKSCIECRFRQYEYCDLQRQDVYAVNIMDYALSFERHPSCPLVEIPTPHGRLIDADKLKSRLVLDNDSNELQRISADILKWIDIQETVIEAEGETDA